MPKKEPEFQAIHVMADGTIRDSIEGVVIPVTEATKPFYDLLAETALENHKLIRSA